MTLIKKCNECGKYTLKKDCKKCNSKTTNPHYTFSKVKDAPKGEFKRRSKS